MTSNSLFQSLIEAAQNELPWRSSQGPDMVHAYGPFLRSIEDDQQNQLWTQIGDHLEENARGSFDAALRVQNLTLPHWTWERSKTGAMGLSNGDVQIWANPNMTPHRGLMLVLLFALEQEHAAS